MLSELYLETKSNPCWKRDQIFLIFTKDFSRGVIFSPYPTHKRRTNLYSSSQIDKMIIWCLHFVREKPPLSNNNTISLLLPVYSTPKVLGVLCLHGTQQSGFSDHFYKHCPWKLIFLHLHFLTRKMSPSFNEMWILKPRCF